IGVPILKRTFILHRLSPHFLDMRSPLRPQSSTARQPVTKQESQFAPERDSSWRVEVLPAARERLVEKGAINAEHYRHWAHRRTRAGGNRLDGRRVMAFGE